MLYMEGVTVIVEVGAKGSFNIDKLLKDRLIDVTPALTVSIDMEAARKENDGYDLVNNENTIEYTRKYPGETGKGVIRLVLDFSRPLTWPTKI